MRLQCNGAKHLVLLRPVKLRLLKTRHCTQIINVNVNPNNNSGPPIKNSNEKFFHFYLLFNFYSWQLSKYLPENSCVYGQNHRESVKKSTIISDYSKRRNKLIKIIKDLVSNSPGHTCVLDNFGNGFPIGMKFIPHILDTIIYNRISSNLNRIYQIFSCRFFLSQ